MSKKEKYIQQSFEKFLNEHIRWLTSRGKIGQRFQIENENLNHIDFKNFFPVCWPAACIVNSDLSGVYLVESDLRNADLRGTSFTGADLRNADMRGVDLRCAQFTTEILGVATLQGSIVSSTALPWLISRWDWQKILPTITVCDDREADIIPLLNDASTIRK
jgi:uncharacterized protein YjbI with pentapeptide repeats